MTIGRRIVRLATTASTMDDAAALAAGGEPEGTVVVAGVQTAGRGRAGRGWAAPVGTSILCSVLLRPTVAPSRLGTLPLLAGVAVAETVEAVTDRGCQLKWPNDVLIGSGKVAGVLMAARADADRVEHAIVGIGLNVNVAPDALPAGAASLLAATGRGHDLDAVLALLLRRLDAAYRAFIERGGRPELDGWRRRALYLGEPVAVRDGERTLRGVMRGVADDGALLLEREDGALARVVAGDLVRGPVPLTGGGSRHLARR